MVTAVSKLLKTANILSACAFVDMCFASGYLDAVSIMSVAHTFTQEYEKYTHARIKCPKSKHHNRFLKITKEIY